MRKRWLIGLLAAVAVALVAGLVFWNTDDAKDRRVWRRFTDELTDANVTRIEFGGPGRPMTLSDADRSELLALLRQAEFDRSNRAGEGPTPGAVISLIFRDGRQVNIGMWGFTTYELSPHHLDPGAQFLIKSEPLGIWLKNRFTGPTIGAGGQQAPGAVSISIVLGFVRFQLPVDGADRRRRQQPRHAEDLGVHILAEDLAANPPVHLTVRTAIEAHVRANCGTA